MALKLLQQGTGTALVVCAGPMPRPGQPWELPAAAIAALGPVPCIVGCAAPRPLNERPDPTATDTETMTQIQQFAEEQVGRRLWLAALIGFSAGCRRVRSLWVAGAAALAVILADGLHASKPPDSPQLEYARELVADARAGRLLLIIGHTYIEVGPKITSTSEMARIVTGWALAPPPIGHTIRRVELPPPGSPPWSGLVVYSTGSGPADSQAHRDQALRVLPLALAGRVRELVELPARPDVPALGGSTATPQATPEPSPENVLEAGGPAPRLPASAEGPGGSMASGTIMLLGDSLAEGLGRTLASVAREGAVPFAWSAKPSTTVRSWNTSALPAILGSPPLALVLVCLGTNSLRGNDPPGQGAEAGPLIDRIRAAGVRDIAWIGPPELAGDTGAFRPALAQACADRGVRIFASEALPLPKDASGIHLTSAGYATWARAIAAWVPFSAYADDGTAPPPPPPAPALLTLRSQLDASWPSRSRRLDGIPASPEHRAQSQREHRASDHDDSNALDVTYDAVHGPDLDALATALLRDARSHYVIWNRRIANPEKDAGVWRPYTGSNPHTDHLHLSIYPDRREDPAAWDLSGGDGPLGPPHPEVSQVQVIETLPGRLAPWPPPFRPGEGRRPINPAEPIGVRAAWFSLDEQRAGVRDGSPRIAEYRRGQGTADDPWDAAAFCFAAQQVLQPNERLPHAYSSLVSSLIRTGRFHRLGDGYEPRRGDGAIWAYYGDPTQGGAGAAGGRIDRVLVAPGAESDAALFETIGGDAGGGWQQRDHRLDEPGLLGWLEYPPLKLPTVPESIVVEERGALPFEEYIARVVTGERPPGAREPQALMALAMAARSYAVWMMVHEGWGTAAKPMPNSQREQVFAAQAAPVCTRAAQATRGGLVLHDGKVVLCFHVAGAIWRPGASSGAQGSDPMHTERDVTYNQGRVGGDVHPTPLGSFAAPDNRGCLSQNGAVALAQQGAVWPQILRFFYGRDISFTIPSPAPRAPSGVSGAAKKGDGGGGLLLASAAALALYRSMS